MSFCDGNDFCETMITEHLLKMPKSRFEQEPSMMWWNEWSLNSFLSSVVTGYVWLLANPITCLKFGHAGLFLISEMHFDVILRSSNIFQPDERLQCLLAINAVILQIWHRRAFFFSCCPLRGHLLMFHVMTDISFSVFSYL